MNVAQANAQQATNYILQCVYRDPDKAPPTQPEPWPTPDDNYETKSTGPVRPPSGSFGGVVASMFAAQRRKRELLNG